MFNNTQNVLLDIFPLEGLKLKIYDLTYVCFAFSKISDIN